MLERVMRATSAIWAKARVTAGRMMWRGSPEPGGGRSPRETETKRSRMIPSQNTPSAWPSRDPRAAADDKVRLVPAPDRRVHLSGEGSAAGRVVDPGVLAHRAYDAERPRAPDGDGERGGGERVGGGHIRKPQRQSGCPPPV